MSAVTECTATTGLIDALNVSSGRVLLGWASLTQPRHMASALTSANGALAVAGGRDAAYVKRMARRLLFAFLVRWVVLRAYVLRICAHVCLCVMLRALISHQQYRIHGHRCIRYRNGDSGHCDCAYTQCRAIWHGRNCGRQRARLLWWI